MAASVRSQTADASLLPTRTRRQRAAVQPDGIFEVRTRASLIGLTFDDGPDPAYTPQVLDLLDRYEARATFFVVGVNALAHPGLLAELTGRGHDVANHTFDHAELELLTPAEVADEIDRGERAILQAGGPRTRLFRPPKGFTDHAVDVYADAGRYRTVFWSACLERFIHRTPVEVGVGRLLPEIGPGSIVLAHDGGHIAASGRPVIDRSHTVEALPRLLEGLRNKGLRAVGVENLLAAARRHRATLA